MSAAEELRAAARLMRSRSHDAAEAWGGDAWTAGEIGYDDRQGLTYDVHARGSLVAATACEELSEHIASWHPAAALAVADWLDLVAEDCEYDDSPAYVSASLAVARAYLGESA